MNPINWVIVAAILDVPLKLSYHQSQTVMKWQCLTAACCYVGFDMEQTLSDVYPRLTSRFRETVGSTFPLLSKQGVKTHAKHGSLYCSSF